MVSETTHDLRLSRVFIFWVPICLTIVLFLLLLFCLLNLRSQPHPRLDWLAWLRIRSTTRDDISTRSMGELGLKKDVREMLPIVVFKESFFVNDTQCSVCLGDYVAGDRLQQIPACGHTFHVDCIDLWLEKHTTCPICRRQSLNLSTKSQSTQLDIDDTAASDAINI